MFRIFARSGIQKLSIKTIPSFLLSLALCLSVIAMILNNKINLEVTLMEQLALEKSIKISDVLSKLLYKTQMLATLVIQHDGEIEDFEQIAATVVDDPAILNVLVAPSGVVSDIYPLQGNEAVIGLDFFAEGAGNKEALIAKETGQLVLGGPFDLVQDGQALVGRLPVYTDAPDGKSVFWGLVSVTLKLSEILDDVGLETLETQGLSYTIWRINPDDNEKQVIASSENHYNERVHFVEKPIQILNTEWVFSVFSVRGWYQRPESWIMILIGFSISLLLAFIMQNNYELKTIQSRLEDIVRTDELTRIFNRHYFMELASMQLEKSARLNSNCFIIIFDLDHFNEVNDHYGHQTGDEVLKASAVRVKRMIRSYDVLARYGGKEFIMLISDIDTAGALSFVERIRQHLAELPFELSGEQISITASFGMAAATPGIALDTLIDFADQALSQAKESGRNKIVFYNPPLTKQTAAADNPQ